MQFGRVKLIVREEFRGTRQAVELFADLAAQNLLEARGNVWTPTTDGGILEPPTVKS
ncbi:hypothetical protein [Ethanoligenens sp.]|uniref:hypothetical protein n=1 Tax=Ethanoligenens sp. TaxID=2099655 RepID=UPI0039ED14CF